jgi:hypothetical protein
VSEKFCSNSLNNEILYINTVLLASIDRAKRGKNIPVALGKLSKTRISSPNGWYLQEKHRDSKFGNIKLQLPGSIDKPAS